MSDIIPQRLLLATLQKRKKKKRKEKKRKVSNRVIPFIVTIGQELR